MVVGDAAPMTAHPVTVLSVLRSPTLLTREVLAGMVTTLALIPEVISFSIVAGVDPMVSLMASVVLVLTMSILGGRPAGVTAAAGSVALVIAPLVHSHGVRYVLPAMILAGVIQIGFGLAGLARLMRFIPRSVMIGFVNALGILIFKAQIDHVLHVSRLAYALFALTFIIIFVVPRFTTVVPAPLIAIVVVTAVVIIAGLTLPNAGDEGTLSGQLPGLTPFNVPISFDTLRIVWPTALSVAMVGLMETLLTARLVDDMTETHSHKGRESWALGVANIPAGFCGGIGGCAMVGQTVVNVKIGRARTRISTIVAGIFMLVLVTGLNSVLRQIPMVALAAVMMFVAASTVDWHSVKPDTLKRMPIAETLIMTVTVAVVVGTNNLAIGVIVGVMLAMILFARRIAHVITVHRTIDPLTAAVHYEVLGPLFFGSSNDLVEQFSYPLDPPTVTINLSQAQIWDASSVAALDSIETKYHGHGTTVIIEGLDERSAGFHQRLTGKLGV